MGSPDSAEAALMAAAAADRAAPMDEDDPSPRGTSADGASTEHEDDLMLQVSMRYEEESLLPCSPHVCNACSQTLDHLIWLLLFASWRGQPFVSCKRKAELQI